MKAALRLRRPADFACVQRGGAIIRHPMLLISVRGNELSHNRYGIVTSRRLGKAVVRNRCKRRLRSMLRQAHHGLVQGFDVVVVARPGIARQPFSEQHRILNKLLRQSRLFGNR